MSEIDLAGKTPREVDTILRAALAKKSFIIQKLDKANETYKELENRINRAFKEQGRETDETMLGMIEDNITRSQNRISEVEDSLFEIEAELTDVEFTIDACKQEFNDRMGWSRFWLENPSRKVHASPECSGEEMPEDSVMECMPAYEPSENSLMEWLPEYAGSTDVKVVTNAGSNTCTVCFPDAPADLLVQEPKI